jgi:potassium channel subfamily K
VDTVLQDAFSSRYKSAVHNGVFESAVKKYRRRMRSQGKRKAKEEVGKELRIPVRVQPSVVKESSARAQERLESLPGKVLEQARIFHRYIHYLVQGEPEGIVFTDLTSMLDDISQARRLDEKMKDEILQDDDARNVSTKSALRQPLN